ncbi:MAG: right-handed parallel beta-helix repeat-containing protein [Thermodesulfobacteriota bacterium]
MFNFIFRSKSIFLATSILFAVISCGGTGGNKSGDISTGEISESESTVVTEGNVLHVDNQHPDSSDTNPGTAELPLKTISIAAGIADDFKKANVSTTVLIHPGTYRESINFPFINDKSQAKMIFEASEKGKVIVSGSDIWTDWDKQQNSNIYSHDWPFDWGTVKNPWESLGQNLEEIVLRREMIFVNGEKLTQVLSKNELEEKSFYVSESQNNVLIMPPKGVDVNDSIIEVAVRSGLFIVKNRINLELRGIVFQHDNNGVDHSAVEIDNSPNLILEDCSFVWNNWGGLGLFNTTILTARRNIANHNGGRGMSAYKIKKLLFEGNETSYNNWRGVRGGFIGFAVSGLKHLRIHGGVYKNHTSIGNATRGFWLDFDNTNIVIENAIWKDNLKDAIFIEANEGPISIIDSAICNNKDGRGAIIGGNSENVTLKGNLIYNNGNSQIQIEGGNARNSNNWETGESFTLDSIGWIIEDNVIVGSGNDQLLIERIGSNNFLENFVSDGNIWINSADEVFKASRSKITDFDGWKSETEQDQDSVFENSMPTLSNKHNELLNICLEEVKNPSPITYVPAQKRSIKSIIYRKISKLRNQLSI